MSDFPTKSGKYHEFTMNIHFSAPVQGTRACMCQERGRRLKHGPGDGSVAALVGARSKSVGLKHPNAGLLGLDSVDSKRI